MLPILDVAKTLGLTADDVHQYGPLAKLSWPTVNRLRAQGSRGKLVLVTAMTPTKYGEGKTTTSIGLVQGLARRGVKAMAALREPSLGPVFGAKGGGTGGGQATLEPSARINLHCTGDLHAITAANNLLSALVDNAINFHQRRFKTVTWKRCIDMNDRFLRNMVIGLGGSAHGVPREDGFDITAASEIMATLCLSDGVKDLKARLGRLIVGIDDAHKPITAGDLNAVGAMAALLGDALLPNLAQTNQGVPALIHGGPFANIAHGCNSVMATRSALALADVVVTEAGFAFDLGGEKFLDLKCRMSGLWPSAVVLVVTARALRAHGGDEPGLGSIERGFANVRRHLAAIRGFGLEPVLSLNIFAQDTEEELALVERLAAAERVGVARNSGFLEGGQGSEAVAALVQEVLAKPASTPRFSYELGDSFETKVSAIAKKVYGAKGAELTHQATKDLERLRSWGLGDLPVCVAKTHLSLSDDPAKVNAPTDFVVTVRQVRASAGAGFLLALTGEILTMPGLPKVPAAYNLDLTEAGDVVGVQ
jgi:formate--tetrahydrofolate ligase